MSWPVNGPFVLTEKSTGAVPPDDRTSPDEWLCQRSAGPVLRWTPNTTLNGKPVDKRKMRVGGKRPLKRMSERMSAAGGVPLRGAHLGVPLEQVALVTIGAIILPPYSVKPWSGFLPRPCVISDLLRLTLSVVRWRRHRR